VLFEIATEKSRSQLGNELFAAVTCAGTAGGGASLEGSARERAELLKPDCNPDRSRRAVLSGRGLSPAISGEARHGELPHQGVKDE
jgi:hypothetical protein